ncbi:MAG: hypothetical protein WA004_16905, partial [Saprospiraceae bacterium]
LYGCKQRGFGWKNVQNLSLIERTEQPCPLAGVGGGKQCLKDTKKCDINGQHSTRNPVFLT